jgi:hypothetical protein
VVGSLVESPLLTCRGDRYEAEREKGTMNSFDWYLPAAEGQCMARELLTLTHTHTQTHMHTHMCLRAIGRVG